VHGVVKKRGGWGESGRKKDEGLNLWTSERRKAMRRGRSENPGDVHGGYLGEWECFTGGKRKKEAKKCAVVGGEVRRAARRRKIQ